MLYNVCIYDIDWFTETILHKMLKYLINMKKECSASCVFFQLKFKLYNLQTRSLIYSTLRPHIIHIYALQTLLQRFNINFNLPGKNQAVYTYLYTCIMDDIHIYIPQKHQEKKTRVLRYVRFRRKFRHQN